MKDQVRFVDGPLEGRTFLLDETPTTPIEVHAAVAPDGNVLAIEGETTPTGTLFQPREFRYAPLVAKDGHQSRADDGFLLFYAAASEAAPE